MLQKKRTEKQYLDSFNHYEEDNTKLTLYNL